MGKRRGSKRHKISMMRTGVESRAITQVQGKWGKVEWLTYFHQSNCLYPLFSIQRWAACKHLLKIFAFWINCFHADLSLIFTGLCSSVKVEYWVNNCPSNTVAIMLYTSTIAEEVLFIQNSTVNVHHMEACMVIPENLFSPCFVTCSKLPLLENQVCMALQILNTICTRNQPTIFAKLFLLQNNQ